jgi:hypothetical protein
VACSALKQLHAIAALSRGTPDGATNCYPWGYPKAKKPNSAISLSNE